MELPPRRWEMTELVKMKASMRERKKELRFDLGEMEAKKKS